MIYSTHARTPEELRDEVVSDIRRRIAVLATLEQNARGATEKSRYARAAQTLEEMLEFWSNLEIHRPLRRRLRQGIANVVHSDED